MHTFLFICALFYIESAPTLSNVVLHAQTELVSHFKIITPLFCLLVHQLGTLDMVKCVYSVTCVVKFLELSSNTAIEYVQVRLWADNSDFVAKSLATTLGGGAAAILQLPVTRSTASSVNYWSITLPADMQCSIYILNSAAK